MTNKKKLRNKCKTCGRKFFTYPSQKRDFCNRKCFAIHWKKWRNSWGTSFAKNKHWLHTQEYKDKFSKMRMGENNPMFGRKQSEEEREKHSRAMKKIIKKTGLPQNHHLSYDPEIIVRVFRKEHWVFTMLDRFNPISEGLIKGLRYWVRKNKNRAIKIKN